LGWNRCSSLYLLVVENKVILGWFVLHNHELCVFLGKLVQILLVSRWWPSSSVFSALVTHIWVLIHNLLLFLFFSYHIPVLFHNWVNRRCGPISRFFGSQLLYDRQLCMVVLVVLLVFFLLLLIGRKTRGSSLSVVGHFCELALAVTRLFVELQSHSFFAPSSLLIFQKSAVDIIHRLIRLSLPEERILFLRLYDIFVRSISDDLWLWTRLDRLLVQRFGDRRYIR